MYRPIFQPPKRAAELLLASCVQLPFTGSTTETVIATLTLPAGRLAVGSMLRIEHAWSMSTSANNKVPRWRLGGLAGTSLFSQSYTATSEILAWSLIRITGTSAQSTRRIPVLQDSTWTSISALTATQNTANALDLVATVKLFDVADSLNLEHFAIEYIPPVT